MLELEALYDYEDVHTDVASKCQIDSFAEYYVGQ